MDKQTESKLIEKKKRNFVIIAVVVTIAVVSFKIYADTQIAKG